MDFVQLLELFGSGVWGTVKLFTVAKYFGSLGDAQKVHFNDGGQFDKLYTPGAK